MTDTQYPDNRITRENSALVLVDHQLGLILGVHDQDQEQLRRNVVSLAGFATAYDIPVVITTSADDGPNGDLLPELSRLLPDATLIRRPGEIDAFDNQDFEAAIRATGRSHLIIAGISTDVCVTFAAMSAISRGYHAHAVLDASGTWSALAFQAAAARMQTAGVVLNSTVAVAAELQRDWRNPGGAELAAVFSDSALPFYGSLVSFATR